MPTIVKPRALHDWIGDHEAAISAKNSTLRSAHLEFAQSLDGGGILARYLVTGAASFIGRSIAAALLARDETVRGIDNFITGKRTNLAGLEAMDLIEGDLAHPADCARACAGVEIAFHEAALASVPRSEVP